MVLSAWQRRGLLLTPLLLASCVTNPVTVSPRLGTETVAADADADAVEVDSQTDYRWVGLAAEGACLLVAAYMARQKPRKR